MCLNIKNFYLRAALDYYEYMKIPLALFPEWIKKQYNLDTNVCISGNTTNSVGTPASWNFCKQITPKATQATRVL
jgi:hypothetical protein